MSIWNERVHHFSASIQQKMLRIAEHEDVWNKMVSKIREDSNVLGVFTDEIRFGHCSDDQYANSKKRAIWLVLLYYSAIKKEKANEKRRTGLV